MLGPNQLCHKKAYLREGWAAVGKGSWGELLKSSVRVGYSRRDLRDLRLMVNFSHNYAKIQTSF